jgi:hypothetical protein
MRIRFAPAVAAAMVALTLVACNGAGLPTFSAAPTAVPTASTAPTAEPTADVPTDTPGAIPDDSANPPTSGTGAIDLARLATGETPDGWVEVISRDGHCRQAVPNDWLTDIIVGFGDSPDLHVQSMVADDLVPQWNTWPEYIVALKATFFNALSGGTQEVLVETDDLYLMREASHKGGYVISRNNHDGTACGILLTVDEAFADQWAAINVQILYTLALAEPGPTPSPTP